MKQRSLSCPRNLTFAWIFQETRPKRDFAPEQARKAILDGFEKGAQAIGKKANLDDAIKAVPAQHELIKTVTHKDENALFLDQPSGRNGRGSHVQ